MFVEFITKKGEKFSLNVFKILYYTPNKGGTGTIIFDSDGLDYEVTMLYDNVKELLSEFINDFCEDICARIRG